MYADTRCCSSSRYNNELKNVYIPFDYEKHEKQNVHLIFFFLLYAVENYITMKIGYAKYHARLHTYNI
jgi:hypothetical protein